MLIERRGWYVDIDEETGEVTDVRQGDEMVRHCRFCSAMILPGTGTTRDSVKAHWESIRESRESRRCHE